MKPKALLLVDAVNAFNTINQKAALHDIRVSCADIYQLCLTIITANQFDYWLMEEEIYQTV